MIRVEGSFVIGNASILSVSHHDIEECDMPDSGISFDPHPISVLFDFHLTKKSSMGPGPLHDDLIGLILHERPRDRI